MTPAPALRFAEMVRDLGMFARRYNLTVPGYRGVLGGPYEVHHRPGTVTVQVDHHRPERHVMADLLRGLADARRCPDCTEVLDVNRRCPAGHLDHLDADPDHRDRPTSTDRFGGRNR